MIDLLNTKNLSGLFQLNLKDVFKGAILAAIAGLIEVIISQVSTGKFNHKELIIVVVVSFLAYLKSRFLSNENGDFLKQ